jgi:RNA polymerase sigma factor (sigma-70 family)
LAETNTLRDVVIRAQIGDHDAFSELVRRFQDMVVGYAYSVIGDFHLAEDAAQEAFAAAWIELPRLREPEAFAGWIRRLVFTRSTRFTRKMRSDQVTLESVGELEAPLEVTDGNEEVYRALSELPDDERIATTLFYFGSHSHDRIADFLDLTPATVNNRLRSARKRMKQGLIEMAEETFKRETPSRNEAFEARVKKLTQPREMETDHYVYGVEQLNGHDAWALFCAAAAGDLVRVRALLGRDPRLVNAQHWYQFPIHMAVREGHADVV